jgi:hypothetical protein
MNYFTQTQKQLSIRLDAAKAVMISHMPLQLQSVFEIEERVEDALFGLDKPALANCFVDLEQIMLRDYAAESTAGLALKQYYECFDVEGAFKTEYHKSYAEAIIEQLFRLARYDESMNDQVQSMYQKFEQMQTPYKAKYMPEMSELLEECYSKKAKEFISFQVACITCVDDFEAEIYQNDYADVYLNRLKSLFDISGFDELELIVFIRDIQSDIIFDFIESI